MKSILIAIMLVFTQGCATCERHPVACKVVVITTGVIAAGALATHHRNDTMAGERTQTPRPPDCSRPSLCN